MLTIITKFSSMQEKLPSSQLGKALLFTSLSVCISQAFPALKHISTVKVGGFGSASACKEMLHCFHDEVTRIRLQTGRIFLGFRFLQ
jgi:hypothetical protein